MRDTLDLSTSVISHHECASPSSQSMGWLSPRISFSKGIVDQSSDEGSGSSGEDDLRSDAHNFEFCMGSASLNPLSGGGMLSADELFYNGRLLPQNLPLFHPQRDRVPGSFSGPLDTMKTPFVNADWAPQRPSASMSGPLGREEASMLGPGIKQPRFSGPLDMRPIPPLPCAGPWTAASSSGVPTEEAGKPKSQTWEKVIGLLRRARSDSHKDRLCPIGEHSGFSRKQSSDPQPKNSGSAANLLRSIFRRNSSTTKTGKAIPSETSSSSSSKNRLPKFSSSCHTCVATPPTPFSTPHVQAEISKPAVLPPVHVAPPVYPTSFATKADREESEVWTSSTTDVEMRPVSARESWRMLERENSLELTFDRFDTSHVGEFKKELIERSAGTATAARNPSRIVLKNLERCSNPASQIGKGQDQLRALRAREIWRSPTRLTSYRESVRITPVLNVPVCIAPAMQSSKAAKRSVG